MNTEFLDLAIDLARRGMRAGEGGPFGAVIVRDGEVVAEGTNTVVASLDPTCHAEIVAIRRATAALGTFDLSGCELYVNGEPCPMCVGAIHWARLDRVYYATTREDAAAIGFDDSRILEELCRPAGEREVPFTRHPVEAAREVFEEWREKPDKVEY